MTVTLILARADNGVIGNKGTIPWRIADDMQRFKKLTMGKTVVMGRRTWESLPKRPLPGRTNIVVSRDRNYRAAGATVVHSLTDALEKGAGHDIMIAGGAEIYLEALAHASRIELTEVHGTFEGDVTLEDFDRSIWHEKAKKDRATSGGLRYSYITLERTAARV